MNYRTQAGSRFSYKSLGPILLLRTVAWYTLGGSGESSMPHATVAEAR